MPTWSPSLAIGVEEVDRQHRKLFERADALLDGMRARESDAELKVLFWFVDDYCTSHFAAEETLMREVGYPGIREQIAQHRKFTREFDAIAERFRAKGPTPELTLELQQLICGWFVTHIRALDTKIAAFVADKVS
jgi:hemerythrin